MHQIIDRVCDKNFYSCTTYSSQYRDTARSRTSHDVGAAPRAVSVAVLSGISSQVSQPLRRRLFAFRAHRARFYSRTTIYIHR